MQQHFLTFIISALSISTALGAEFTDPLKGMQDLALSQAQVQVKKTALLKQECTPFNLEKNGLALDGVMFSQQYYANCYSAGAANLVNAWIMNKPNHGDNLSDLNWKSAADRLEAKKLLVSPHHLAIVYALDRKMQDMPKQHEWSELPGKIGDTVKDDFRALMIKKKKNVSEIKRLKEIINQRFYYFEKNGGNTIQTVAHLYRSSVCPLMAVEGVLDTEAKAKKYFAGIKNIYEEYVLAYHPRDNELQVNLAHQKVQQLLGQMDFPSEARPTLEEMKTALFATSGSTFDPLRFSHQMITSLCRKSETQPLISLRELFSGKTAINYPRTSPAFISRGPVYNREFLKIFFKKIEQGNRGQLPLAISYSGHAIWKGTSMLAWNWNPKTNKWEQHPTNGGHQSLVVGRRWNKKAGHCEYQLRNSFDLSTTAKGWSIDENAFGIWVRDEYLYRSMNWAFYLTDQKGDF